MNGEVEGCGIRVMGITEQNIVQSSFRTIDASANVWISGQALGKLIVKQYSAGATSSDNGQRVKLSNGWLKVQGGSPATPPVNNFKESEPDKNAFTFSLTAVGA